MSPGTPESVWLPFLAGLQLPELPLQPPPARVRLVAPHPDDEVLACGGLLAQLAAAGTQVDILAVTDGDASNPGGSLTPAELAGRRREESVAALAELGLAGAGLRRLGLPDGGSDALEAPVLDALLAPVAPAPRAPGATSERWLLAPWHRDGHPDHDAVGRAARHAAEHTGERLLSYPIWAWHHLDPDAAPDTQPDWSRAWRLDLPPAVAEAKARALAQFLTQIQPIGPLPQDAPVLDAAILARFARPFEIVFAGPTP